MWSTAGPGLNYVVGDVIHDISYIFREEYGNCCRYVSCGLFLFRPYFAITDGGMSAAISVFISKLSKRLAYVNSPIRKLADRHCQQASGVRGSGQESSIKSLICMVRFFSRSLLPAFINRAFAKHFRRPSVINFHTTIARASIIGVSTRGRYFYVVVRPRKNSVFPVTRPTLDFGPYPKLFEGI